MNLQILKNTFNWLSAQSYQDVQGVALLDSGNPGTTLGITIMTHGNEPAGLVAAQKIKDTFDNGLISSGKIFLVINNLLATEKYFSAENDKEKRNSRFIDVNMNRLPEDVFTSNRTIKDKRYEVLRSKELLKIWQRFDVACDFHSTSQDSEPMLVVGDNDTSTITNYLPIKTVIKNIHNIQTGAPAFAFYGKGRCKTFEIEAGSHNSTSTFELVSECVEIILTKLNMLEKGSSSFYQVNAKEVYHVTEGVFAPYTGFRMTKIFKNFEEIKQGDVIAKSACGKTTLTSAMSATTLFAFSTLEIDSIHEEILFLAKKV